MRGLITLPSNIIGYVVILAIFVSIMAVIAMFWFNFQTIPTEMPEKATTCDFAYMLSLWDKATVYPNIFNKTFLETWSVDPTKTANSIFENSSDYFLPKSDFFVHIADSDGKVYSLYVPPESKSVYKSCGDAYISEKDFEKIKGTHLETALVENGNIKIFKGESGIIPRNRIESICLFTTFMSDESDVEIGTMVAGLTTNLATKLRDGIYQVGVKNKSQEFYELGGYPGGCLFNGGTNEIKAKRSIVDFGAESGLIIKIPYIDDYISDFTSWVGESIPILDTIWNWFTNKREDAVEWIATTEIHAECGFKWDWDNETRVLSVLPSNLGKYNIDWTTISVCEFNTKIPERVVNESNLSEKLCRPKEAHKHIFTVPGGLDKLNFFLRVGKVKDTWTEDKAVDFCIERCKTSAPWYLAEYDCIAHCKGEGMGGISEYRYAKSQIHLFKNMPDNAINIEYLIVKDSILKEAGAIENVPRNKMIIRSACDSWPTVSDCGTSEQCYGPHCVDEGTGGKCEMCFPKAENSFCSPNYLKNPPSVSEGLYTCQNVFSPLWPNLEENPKCVPVILVNATLNGEMIGEKSTSPPYDIINKIVDCSVNPNSEITWKINASGLCCANVTTEIDDEGVERLVCKEEDLTGFCPKMKLWSSINSSNAVVLNDERYIFNITQKVCRNDAPYNNAKSAFIVANYTTEKTSMEYVLKDSEIKLITTP